MQAIDHHWKLVRGDGLYWYNYNSLHRRDRLRCFCTSNSMASFCCSIEMEPKTLSQGQLTHAREVAVDIVQKQETIEASRIFDEGMTPVIGIKEMTRAVEKRDYVYKLDDQCNDESGVTLTVCQCSVVCSTVIDTPDQAAAAPKEPLSAPF